MFEEVGLETIGQSAIRFAVVLTAILGFNTTRALTRTWPALSAIAVGLLMFFRLTTVASSVACPLPTVASGAECVLASDETLTNALRLPSGVTLDCRGHELRPRQRGQEASQTREATPSVPVVGIFLNDVDAVTVHSCGIRDFDFGVVIVNGKGRPGNSILNNSVFTLYQGVTMIETDNNLVRANTIIAQSGGSVGILQLQDSDHNRIDANVVESPSTGSLPPNPLYPGAPFSNPGWLGDGIFLGSLPQILGFHVEDTFLQFVRDPANYAAGNIIENNRVAVKGLWGNGKKSTTPIGIGSYQKEAIVRNNTVTEGSSYGIGNLDENFFYGTSVLNEEDFYPRDTLIENNFVSAKSNGTGITVRHAVNSIVRGNLLGSPSGSGSGAGIALVGPALETATVIHNRIARYRAGLRFRRTAFVSSGSVQAAFYGAKVYLNDVLDSNKQGVEIIGDDYNFPTELSVNGQGNHWGRSCADSDGFRESGENNPDSPSSYIKDSHAYGQPVAGTPDSKLPVTCS